MEKFSWNEILDIAVHLLAVVAVVGAVLVSNLEFIF